MKHRLFFAALLCAALLMSACAALAAEATAEPEGRTAIYEIVLSGEEHTQRALFLLNESGLPTRVMERFEFTRPATDEERQAISANYSAPPTLSADGQTVYAPWTDAEVADAFGDMDAQQFAAYLALLGGRDGAEQSAALAQPLYQYGSFSLTLDAVHFSPRFGLTLSCTAVNGYQKKAWRVQLTECVADGLCLPLGMQVPLTIAAGERVSFVVAITGEASDALRLLSVEGVNSLAVRYRISDENGETVRSDVSSRMAIPGGEGASATAPIGEPLCDEAGVRAYDLGFDAAAGRVTLLLEKTTGAEWRDLCVDAVFDGLQTGRGLEVRLEGGQRRVCTFAAEQAVSGVAVYLTPDHVNSLRKPLRLTLGNPAPMKEQTEEAPPLWTAGECEVRFAGVSGDYFADSDALLFECINRSESQTYWLYPVNGRVYLDGQSMRTRTTSAACYPGTRCTAALAVADLGAVDLSAYQQLEVKLGLYALEGVYLKQRYSSGGLSVALK